MELYRNRRISRECAMDECGHVCNAVHSGNCRKTGTGKKLVRRLLAAVSAIVIMLPLAATAFLQKADAAQMPSDMTAGYSLSAGAKYLFTSKTDGTLKRSELNTVFAADSYWKMTLYNYTEKEDVLAEYYVRLEEDCRYAAIISAKGDDLRVDKFTWEYDDANALLTIEMLEDGYANSFFRFQDGVFVCEGTYYKTELVHMSGSKRRFESALRSFQRNYGGYNPAKRLVTTNAHFRYIDISAMDSMSYDIFQYFVNYKSFGLVVEPAKEKTASIRRELSAIPGGNAARKIRVDTVMLGVVFPEENTGSYDAASEADVINLIYRNDHEASDAFSAMQSGGKKLLQGAATGGNMCSNDLFDGFYYWNDTQAVAIIRIGLSILVFRGPTSDIQFMTQYLGLDGDAWY